MYKICNVHTKIVISHHTTYEQTWKRNKQLTREVTTLTSITRIYNTYIVLTSGTGQTSIEVYISKISRKDQLISVWLKESCQYKDG